MKLKTLCALLLFGSGSGIAPAAYAFEESPAVPERLIPGRTGLTALYWARRYNQDLAESLLIAQGASREAWPIPER